MPPEEGCSGRNFVYLVPEQPPMLFPSRCPAVSRHQSVAKPGSASVPSVFSFPVLCQVVERSLPYGNKPQRQAGAQGKAVLAGVALPALCGSTRGVWYR